MRENLIAGLFLFCGFGQAQTSNDCSNATVLCGNSIITSNASGLSVQKLDGSTDLCEFLEVKSLWLELNIDLAGMPEFTLTPDDNDIIVDYDFYIFRPNYSYGSGIPPIWCSTTNPEQDGLSENLTGLRAGCTDESEGPGPPGEQFYSTATCNRRKNLLPTHRPPWRRWGLHA